MLRDLVTAIRETMLYEPRNLRHHVTNLRVWHQDGSTLEATANFSVIEVLPKRCPVS